MGVQGYLSLYTMLLGWQQYDLLWSIMISTGLFYLPFVYIVVKNWLQPLLSQEPKSAAVISVRRIIVGLVSGLTILCIAGIPTVTLQPKVIHFQPVCEQTARIATPGNSGTTYDNLPIPDNISIPLLWYVVLALSNGITDAAIAGLSCAPVDLRALQNEIDLTTIQNPQLKQQTQQFYQQCYLPAYDRYMHAEDGSPLQKSIAQAKTKYGQDDVAWMGSSTLTTVPGLYNSIQASQAVVGFPFDVNRDAIDGQVNPQPKWGDPMCDQWWSDETYGLRAALYNQLSAGTQYHLSKLNQQFPEGGDSLQNAAIKALIEKSTTTMGFFDRGYASEEDNRSGLDNTVAKIGARVFTVKTALAEYPKLHILMNALPIIQAVLLFGIFALLAIALPLSGYSIGFCFTASVMLFSVIFCSYLWHLVSWFDSYLLQALYGAPTDGSIDGVSTWAGNLLTNTISPGRILTDLTISVFYCVLPLFWLGMTNWAGISGGTALNSLSASGSTDMAANVGKSTGNAIGSVGNAITMLIKKGK